MEGSILAALTCTPGASHANQTTLYLTPLHGWAEVLKRLTANVGAA